MALAKEPGIFKRTHAGRKVESETNSASNATLSSSVRTNNHVQMRARAEFDKVIGDKVLELNPNNGSRHISLAVIRYRPNSSDICSPIRVSD